MTKTKKIIVLLVEDDEVLLRALFLAFHEGAYTIATAADGDTGLKMAERMKPDIILLDLLLPKMNGFDFLKNIKADPALKSIPVVVLSNLGDDENIDKARALGALDYFVKSNVNLSTIAEKIAKTVKVRSKVTTR
jgi:DNA-binding response OmpR family regulator